MYMYIYIYIYLYKCFCGGFGADERPGERVSSLWPSRRVPQTDVPVPPSRGAPETVEYGGALPPNASEPAEPDAALAPKVAKTVESGIDFHRFLGLRRADDSTRGAKCRTFVFAGRRGTFKGSQTLQKN